MSPAHTPIDPPRTRRNRPLIWGALLLMSIGLGLFAVSSGGPDTREDQAHLVVLGSWVVLAGAYAWMRFRPRKPYGDAARPKSEAFQRKRARLLILCAGYLALVVTPMEIWQSLTSLAHASTVDRIFYAAMFIGSSALVLGLVTTGIYSRQWSALVDDELSLANRLAAFRAGFWVFAGLGATALVVSFLRPEWAVAAIPAVAGPAVAAAGLRFALLERAAAGSDE
ncbi:MAG TPA: hypothetical protein VGG29_06620 [Caulobacteraceae bacterium]|jgi:hypothetical protein